MKLGEYFDRLRDHDKATVKGDVRAIVSLNRTGKLIYPGTVPAHVKARRRAANKVARRSRALNRRSR